MFSTNAPCNVKLTAIDALAGDIPNGDNVKTYHRPEMSRLLFQRLILYSYHKETPR